MPTFTIPEREKKKTEMVSPGSTAEERFSPLSTPSITVTSWKDNDVMQFLIYQVLRLKKEKDDDNNEIENTIYRALIENDINSPKIWLNLSDATITNLQYTDKKKKINLVAGQQILIQQIRDFIKWKFSNLRYSNNI